MAKTILTVDDSMSIRETVKLTLQPAGYDMLDAEDGVKGLEVCKANKIDLVIADLNMPNMDGITMVKHIRALPQYKFTPILLLTTESQQEKKVEGKEAGATGWIVKPFAPDKLLAVSAKVCPL